MNQRRGQSVGRGEPRCVTSRIIQYRKTAAIQAALQIRTARWATGAVLLLSPGRTSAPLFKDWVDHAAAL